jgi:hypothetical protein
MGTQLPILSSAILLITAGAASADGLGDSLGPREVAVGEGLRAGASGALATTLNPAGLPLSRVLVFEGSYGYRPDDSASLLSVSACDATNVAPGCFYYRYAGTSTDTGETDVDHRTHVVGGALARSIGARAMIGVGAKYVDFESSSGEETDVSGFLWDIGGLVRLTDTVNLGAVGYNVLGIDTPEFPRAVAGGVYMKPTAQIALGFDAKWALDDSGDTGRYGGGGEYFVTGGRGEVGYPLRLGVVHDVTTGTYVTGGLGMSTEKMAIDIGGRKQVSDGDELLLTVSLRIFGPRL